MISDSGLLFLGHSVYPGLSYKGHFELFNNGNAVPIVEKLPERMKTGKAFQSLKCLRAHYGQHCEPFTAKMH